MSKAIWKGVVIAEAPRERCHEVEGNIYFPPDSIQREYFRKSGTHTVCHWKGTASYYDVVVKGETNKDAAWYYPDPSEAARRIKNYIAFWHGVQVEE